MRIILQMGLIFLLAHGFSQDTENIFLEEMISSYSETSDLEPNEEEVMACEILKKKININRLNQDDLEKIPFLTSCQIKNLTEYIHQYGEVFSMYELQAVDGFDSVTVRQLTHYVEIGPPLPLFRLTPANLVREGRHEMVLRYQQVMQQQAGYQIEDSTESVEPDYGYLGSPQRYYFRYRYTFFDRIMIGISGDKDAGEEFFTGSQRLGMDFYSGFIVVRNIRWLKTLLVGNFRASFGQGLTLGGSSFGSSVSFGSSMIYSAGFSPSQSVCEYGYLRGVAVTVSTGRFEWSGFFSSTKKDASVLTGDTLEIKDIIFSSFTETGYHRTPMELARKNQISQRVFGGHAGYRGRFFIMGVNGFYGSWSGTLQPNHEAYRQFMLQGDRFGAVGVDSRCRIGFAQIFGEFSISLNGGRAWLLGVSAVPVSGVDLLLICRDYQPQFQNPLSTAISQNSLAANEQGVYLRVQTQLVPKTTVSGYFDLFRFPWLRYRIHTPSEGMEAGLSGQYQASPFWSFSLYYIIKRGCVNLTYSEDKIAPLAEESRNDLKAECMISPNPSITLRSCFALRSYQAAGLNSETGYLGSQEVVYRREGVFRSIRLKYTLFDIPEYNARIYTYEPDLLYSFSAPACYGRGIRCVVLIQAGITRRVDLWGWLGVIKYVDRTIIGSGLESIEGNLKSEVKVQVRVRF